MVEGACRRRNDSVGSAVRIVEDTGGGHMQNAQAVVLQKRIAPLVTLRAVATIMTFTIHFDRQRGLATVEIDNVRPDRMLPPKL